MADDQEEKWLREKALEEAVKSLKAGAFLRDSIEETDRILLRAARFEEYLRSGETGVKTEEGGGL